MISFRCPACAKQYSVKDEFGGRTTACRSCQSSLRVPMKKADLKCLNCGSNSVQSLKLIYEMGTSTGRGIVGDVLFKNRQQSHAAQQAAPPQRKDTAEL